MSKFSSFQGAAAVIVQLEQLLPLASVGSTGVFYTVRTSFVDAVAVGLKKYFAHLQKVQYVQIRVGYHFKEMYCSIARYSITFCNTYCLSFSKISWNSVVMSVQPSQD